MTDLKQSTAYTLKLGPFVDSTDGNTDEIALAGSMTVYLAKGLAGSAIAARNSATAITYDALGYYNVPISTTDTNTLGPLKAIVHVSGALHVFEGYNVLIANEWDSRYSATLKTVNATSLDSSPTAAANLSNAFDGTGYTAANFNIGMVASVTAEVTANLIKIGGSTTSLAKLVALLAGATVGQTTATTLTATTFTTNLTEATPGHYNDAIVEFTTGPLTGQRKLVTGYNGTTKAITCATLTEAPTAGNEFILL